MKKIKRKLKTTIARSLILLAVSLFALPINRAEGEDAASLSITPSVQEMIVEPGRETEQVFELKNLSKIPLPIKSYIRVFGASDEMGGIDITEIPDQQRLSITSWVSVESSDFILQPDQIRKIKLRFSPPADLPPGGYYGILFAEPLLLESLLADRSLQIGGRIGALLFLVGAGEINEKGSIVPLDSPRYILGNSRPDLKIRFQNEGNVHLRPSGKATIENIITKNSRSVEVPEFIVLPGKIRQQIVSVGALKWPGIYKVKTQLYYGRDKIISEETSVLYYLPVVPIIVILLIAGISMSLILERTRKRLIKALKVIIKNGG